MQNHPLISICVLAMEDHFHTIRRCLLSIINQCDRRNYRLIVGANAPNDSVNAFLEELRESGRIDQLITSKANLDKCPMMRLMLAKVQTEFVWWLDDDCIIENGRALGERLKAVRKAPQSIALWGEVMFLPLNQAGRHHARLLKYLQMIPMLAGNDDNSRENAASWSSGKQIFHINGACFLARMKALKSLDWPEHSLLRTGDDIVLSLALQIRNWQMKNIGSCAVATNMGPRRKVAEDFSNMSKQMDALTRSSLRESSLVGEDKFSEESFDWSVK